MRLCRDFGFACLIIFALFGVVARAAPVPAYNGKMNVAVGGVVQAKATRWGFAANDPRVTATFSAIGTGLTTIAIGVGTGAVASVGWPALLIGAGVSALVGGSISFGMDSLYRWAFNSDGTISTSGVQGAPDSPSSLVDMNAGGEFYSRGPYSAGDGYTAIYTAFGCPGPLCPSPNSHYVLRDCGVTSGGYSCRTQVIAHNQTCEQTDCENKMYWGWISATRNASGAPMSCLAGEAAYEGVCSSAGIPSSQSSPGLTSAPAAAAVANVPQSELSKPVSNEMLAAAANAAWKAADPSLGGLPWSPSDPITPADVADWKTANPSKVPSVGDAIAPVSNGSGVAVSPVSTPSGDPAPSPGPVATPGTGTTVDLGPNPNVPAPFLESTPTASSILSPLLNLMPDLKSFAVPSHSAMCPKPSFIVFDKTYLVDSHCGVVESNRVLIEAAMMLVWSIGSVIIILRA